MGGSLSTEEEEAGFTIERSTVRNEKDLTSSSRKLLTPREEERLREKREQMKQIREQNKLLTLRTRMRMEMSQKLTQEFKERVIIVSEDTDSNNNNNGSNNNNHGRGMMLKRNIRRIAFTPRQQLEHKSATKIQASWRGYKVRRKYGNIARRSVVAKELLETERDYIQYLNALVNVYLKPLREKAESEIPLLTLEEVRTIFPQIEMILLYNKQLYDVLDEKIRVSWNAEQTIGDAFLALIDFLKPPYTHYISHFPVITQQIKTVAKRIRVSMYFNNCKNLPECCGLDLSALASMPFQRIPRYILLLKEMIANTHSTHPDHAHLTEAISKMDVLAKTANEKLREQESQRNIMAISNRLDPPIGNLVKPFRKLIREGSMRYKINHSARRTPTGFRAGLIFLFSDCLLITELINHSVTKLLSLADSAVTPKLRPIEVLNLNNSTVLNIMEDYKDRNTNCYDFRVHSLQATVIFELESVVLKDAWINDIAQSINSLTETAISYKARVKRKSVAYGINRKSSSVRLPANVAKAILNSDESLLSSSPSPSSSPLASSRKPHPLASTPPSTPPIASAPTLGGTPSTPSPAVSTPPSERVVATTPTTPRMSLPAPNVFRQTMNISALPAFLSIQRYATNANQSGSLYVDNESPQSPTPTKAASAKHTPPAHALPPTPLSSTVPISSSPRRASNITERKRAESKSNNASETSEQDDFNMDINVNIDQLNFKHEDDEENDNERSTMDQIKEEDEEKSEEDEKDEDEDDEKEALAVDESDLLLQRLNSLETNMNMSMSSLDGFETYDEMAIRITNTLDTKQSFMGLTRTNSESEISRRKSIILPSLPPRSSSLSNLDGLLSR